MRHTTLRWGKRLLLGTALAAALGLGSSCRHAAPSRLIERSKLAMGSSLTVSVWTDDEPTALSAVEAVFSEFDRLEGLLSTWRSDSDVSRINRAAGRQAVLVGRDVLHVLRTARQVSEWTGGKFDVTFGPLTDVWKFDHDQDNVVPPAAAVEHILELVGYKNVEVDETKGSVFLRRAGMRLHLGGIGKGYAVERAQSMLRERGLGHFMIQAGGDLYVAGLRGGRPWRLGIADPRNAERVFATVDLSDSTFSTSGDYERAFVKDGVRYHHLIDPDTGQPARHCRSVTIVAKSALLADGLSTGVFIMGPVPGMALIERLPDVEGVIVSSTNDVLVSSGLRDAFTQREPLMPAADDDRPQAAGPSY